ncbi:CHAT domain-containing protein [Coprinopsis sp. MPI-PUGE-AT-0042]|nr:CHAT domain-containing protein [Coprinopsis sp. MPI-PUGE-AT-0042]
MLSAAMIGKVPHESITAVETFRSQDAEKYGSDIINRQAVVALCQMQCEDIVEVQHALDIQTLLVSDPRVQRIQQMHAIATSYLGAMYHERFKQTMAVEDLDRALSLYQAAVKLSSQKSSSHAHCLHRLVQGYNARCQSADLDDSTRATTAVEVEEALAMAINLKGLSITQQEKDTYFLYEHLQAFLLHQKFNLTGSIDHLHTATSIILQSRCHTSPNAYLKSRVGDLLTELVESYRNMPGYSHSEHVYASEIVACYQKLTAITGSPNNYDNLANSLFRLYERTGANDDIDSAFEALRTSLKASKAAGSKPSPLMLCQLSQVLFNRSNVSGNHELRFQALEIAHQVLLSSREHDSYYYETLFNAYDMTCLVRDATEELADAVAAMEEQINQIPPLSPFYLRGQHIVFTECIRRAVASGDRGQLEATIQHAKDLHKDDPSELLEWLKDVYLISGDPSHRSLAIQGNRLAALDVQRPTSHRLQSARRWIDACGADNVEESLEACDVAIRLLTMVMGLGQRISKNHHRLTEEFTRGGSRAAKAYLPLEAATKAVQCGRIEKALEWLEQGRCLLWNQLQILRAPLHHLAKHSSQLAQRIVSTSRVLESDGVLLDPMDPELQAEIDHYGPGHSAKLARAAKDWDELLEQARKIPGFEDFLRPARCSTLLQDLPGSGSVVVLNAHESRCDAIVLARGMKEPILVPLPKLSYSGVKSMRQQLKDDVETRGLRMREATGEEVSEGEMAEGETQRCHERRFKRKESNRHRQISATESILLELWEAVVKPILDALAFKNKSASPTTRIWWCPIGPFSFLPIHAAGIYGRGAFSECLADYAISSYIPTVSALTARVRDKRERKKCATRLLLVSVPEAKGQLPIHGTTREARALGEFATAHGIDHLHLEGKEANAESVMKEISESSIVHLACHASQNTVDPMQSAFHLQDGQLELFTIIKANLKNGDLAFLSACQTGTGDEKLSNEAIHLAAGMLAAGFRGAVATMWAINDNCAPKLAEDFYKDLLERGREKGGGMDSEDAAFALHYATQELKKRLGGAERSLLAWVPYVHYGL